MSAIRKETLFFMLLVIASLSAFTFPDSYHPFKEKIDFHQLKINSVSDITYGPHKNKYGSSSIVCKGGYFYSAIDVNHHSDFYDGNISLVPTGNYWQTPINETSICSSIENAPNKTELVLHLNKKNVLPIISLQVNPDDLFSYSKGIYITGKSRDFKSASLFFPFPWQQPANYYLTENDKREAFWSYYDKNGKAKYYSYSTIEVSGKATRCFSQKSLRLTAGKKYGSKKFKFDFFKDENNYHSLVLRNGGNDHTKSLFRDMLMQSIAEPSGLLVSGFVPCEVYLNGEYWGIHILQNRADADFIATKRNSNEKNITLIENWQLESGSEKEYKKLMRILNDKNLNYESIKEIIDLDDFANYLTVQFFFANTDWPHNNLKMFLCKNKNVVKWQFAFFDTDYGFGYLGKESINTDMFAVIADRKDNFGKMYNVLMKNPEFRKLFENKIKSFIKNNGNKNNLISQINKISMQLEPAISLHCLRWRQPSSVEDWKEEVDLLRFFAANRATIISKQLNTYFINGN